MLIDRQGKYRGPLGNLHNNRGEILPSQTAMGDLLESGIQAHYDPLENSHLGFTQNLIESRMLMGGSEQDDEDESADRSLFKTNTPGTTNFLASRPFHQTMQADFGANMEEQRAE